MVNGQLDRVVRHLQRVAGAPGLEGLKDGQLLERFAEAREEAAFAALVRRHGPLVLGVCRRVLRDRHDAEDAFQATFLVLLRRARALDRRGSVAGWLHTVAFHVALRARAATARRQRQEKKAASMADATASASDVWSDLQPVLDKELSRLPETYRTAILLCYVQGKTNAEAARLLGWPVGTVKGRLARARDILRTRLARRGISLSAGLLAAALTDQAAAAVPALLTHATVQAALPTAAGSASVLNLAEGALHAMFATKLRWTAVLLVVMGLVALGIGAAARSAAEPPGSRVARAGEPARARTPEKMKAAPASKTAGASAAERIDAVSGRVLGADKRPLGGAQVVVMTWPVRGFQRGPKVLVRDRTDRDGKFRLSLKGKTLPAWQPWTVVAVADGHGPAWGMPDKDHNVELTLPTQQIIRGRLLDVQGQPAANVKVEVGRLGSGRGTGAAFVDLDADGYPDLLVTNDVTFDPDFGFIDLTARAGLDFGADHDDLMRIDLITKTNCMSCHDAAKPQPPRTSAASAPGALVFPVNPADLPFWPRAVTTDANGRFVLRGVGLKQGLGLRVSDDRYAVQTVDLRPETRAKGDEVPLILKEARILEGTVKDATTGRPVPHARLVTGSSFPYVIDDPLAVHGGSGPDARGRRGSWPMYRSVFTHWGWDRGELPDIEAKADEQGRFRIPMHQASSYSVYVTGAPGQPYLPRVQQFAWPGGAVVRQTKDFRLERGALVRGKVTDGNKAVAGARVDFWSKGLKLPEGVIFPRPVLSRTDGTFQAVLPAGSWHLLMNAPQSVYLYQKIAADKLREKATPPTDGTPPVAGGPAFVYPNGWAALELKAGDGPREVTVGLRRAPLLRGRLVDADGRTVAAARMVYLPLAAYTPRWPVAVAGDLNDGGAVTTVVALSQVYHQNAAGSPPAFVGLDLKDGAFAIPANDPDYTYRLFFRDAAGKQGAFVDLAGKEAGDSPRTITLRPCGTAQALFHDAKGRPLPGQQPLLAVAVRGAAKGRAALFRADPMPRAAELRTDADGKINLSGLIPGVTYRLVFGSGKAHEFTVGPGESLALPEFTIDQPPAAKKLAK
jgi:RNA polymerase sigma factor (sigma-70 family)